MSILRWNQVRDPWQEMRRVQEDMDRALRTHWGQEDASHASTGLFPAMNLSSDTERVTVRCEMPGVPMDKVDLSITRDTITLKGQRELQQKSPEVSYHRRERRGGYFNRTINLPFEVDPEKAAATYKNGVLEVVVGRAEATKPRQITIKTT